MKTTPDNLNNNEKARICNEILSYLVEHPDARDTIEGIVGWWLLEQKIKHQTGKIKEVLEELVDKGLLVEQQGKDVHTYYQLNWDAYEKIWALIIKKINSEKKLTKYFSLYLCK